VERSIHGRVNIVVLGAIWTCAAVVAALTLFSFPRVAVVLGVGSLASFLFVFTRLTRVTKSCVEELRHDVVHDSIKNRVGNGTIAKVGVPLIDR
jgi:hypothetical protein